jgi:hypothetical protein
VTQDEEARAAFKAVGDLLERAGLLGGDGRARLLDLWKIYREAEGDAARLTELALLRECPQCSLNLEEYVDAHQ